MEKTLKSGDIIVFKGEEGEWLSKCFAFLTNSDATHAAMVYSPDTIVETIASGVCANKVAITAGHEAYVMRLNPEQDPAPLLKTAHAYLESKNSYDFPGLVILAGVLLFRKLTPNQKLFAIGNKIMLAASRELDKFIQHTIQHKPEKAMVCSQFVYQVFYDCGEDYRIRLKNATLNPKQMSYGFENMEYQISLAEMISAPLYKSVNSIPEVNETEVVTDAESSAEASTEETFLKEAFSTEALAQQLYQALTEGEPQNETLMMGASASSKTYGNILQSGREFLSGLEKLRRILGDDMPIDSMFVLPGDFVNHAENLVNLGEVDVKRVK